MIKIKDFTKKTKDNHIDDANLILEKHRIYGFVGDKSKDLLARGIANLVTWYHGEIFYPEETYDITFFSHSLGPFNRLKNETLSSIMRLFGSYYPAFDPAYCSHLLQKFAIDFSTTYTDLDREKQFVFRTILSIASNSSVNIVSFDRNLQYDLRIRLLRILKNDFLKTERTIILCCNRLSMIENYITDLVLFSDHKVLLNEDLYRLKNQGYRISNYYPEDKKIIATEHLGTEEVYYVFDRITEEDFRKIRKANGSIENLSMIELTKHLMGRAL